MAEERPVSNRNILIGIVALLVLVLGFFFFKSRPTQPPSGPKAESAALAREDSNTVGPEDAQVVLVEFVDYQCPACAYVHPAVKQILSDNPGEIRVVVRNWPLAQHKNARIAAQAAEAAAEQGKFWQMHDALLIRQKEWSESDRALDMFVGYAEEIGIDDLSTFKQAVQSSKFEEKIKRDEADAKQLALPGIPYFFVNNDGVAYTQDLEEFKSKIESYLAE